MLTQAEAAARVQQGAAYLDGAWPEWFRRVDVGVLNMNSPCRCVLGQLDGEYLEAVKRRGLANMARAYGFDVVYSDANQMRHDYPLLQDAWVAEIALRLCAQPEAADAVARTADRGHEPTTRDKGLS